MITTARARGRSRYVVHDDGVRDDTRTRSFGDRVNDGSSSKVLAARTTARITRGCATRCDSISWRGSPRDQRNESGQRIRIPQRSRVLAPCVPRDAIFSSSSLMPKRSFSVTKRDRSRGLRRESSILAAMIASTRSN